MNGIQKRDGGQKGERRPGEGKGGQKWVRRGARKEREVRGEMVASRW